MFFGALTLIKYEINILYYILVCREMLMLNLINILSKNLNNLQLKFK